MNHTNYAYWHDRWYLTSSTNLICIWRMSETYSKTIWEIILVITLHYFMSLYPLARSLNKLKVVKVVKKIESYQSCKKFVTYNYIYLLLLLSSMRKKLEKSHFTLHVLNQLQSLIIVLFIFINCLLKNILEKSDGFCKADSLNTDIYRHINYW